MFTQTTKNHLPYFNHVLELFKKYMTDDYKPYTNEIKKGDTKYESILFATMSLPAFNHYYDLFYINKKKIVPYNIYDILTERGMAYWYMDDGSIQNDGVHFNVYGYDKEGVNRLLETLEKKFKLRCSIHIKEERGANASLPPKYRIYIWKESMPLFKSYVGKYIEKSMLYKLKM